MSSRGDTSQHCPDCPAQRHAIFESVRNRPEGCAFHCIAVEARAPVPSHLYDQHDFAFVRRGLLVRQRVDANGETTSIDMAGPGSLIPLRLASQSGCSPATFAGSRSLICLPSPASNVDHRDIVALQQHTIERLERIADARGRKRAISKVAAALCAIADTVSMDGPARSVPVALQQRDLAQLLGIRPESVSRVLKQLAEEGLIDRDADGIHLLDRQALERV